MKRLNGLAVIAIGAFFSLGAANLSGQDWPQWRGPNRDGKTTGFKAPATWPASLTKKWDVVVGSGVANPSLANDRLYVITREADNEVVRCMNAATNEIVWKDSYAAAPATGFGAGPSGMFAGPRATPTVAAGRVVTLGVSGILSCYDAATGALKWRNIEFEGQVPGFFAASSPIVVDGLCIAQLGASAGEGARRGAAETGAMVAFDLATGVEKWRATEGKPAYGSPVLMTVDGMKVVAAISETHVVAINTADGKVVWQLPYKQGRYNASTPVVDGQTLIFAGPGTGITAVKLTKQGAELNEEEAWKYTDNSLIFNTPVIKQGALFGVSTTDQIFAVNAEHATGWTAPVAPPRPAVGQLLPVGTQTVFAQQAQQPEGERGRGEAARGQGEGRGRGEGQPQRGRGRGRGRGGRPAGGGERAGYGSIVDAGSVMVSLCPSGELVFFKPDAAAYTEVARYKVSEDGDVYSHPILSGNRVYIKDRDSVALFTVE
jgi:outer membrane protein assembly factor BamB